MRESIGPYHIQKELGRGGMGVVYLARDSRLDRDVAVKALPDHLASDPDRLARFEREAKTLAGLTHPNVGGIYGVEEQDGSRFLILEFVDGETLAEALDRGPLPVDDAIEFAAQIAAGVEAAHEAGVIHRDLKPANIKVTPEGKAKVLDFGLARVEEGASSTNAALDSPTMTTPQNSPTIAGAILGTAAYMSPEQARGRRVDKRTDIWSFGVLLYEMLVGASPFHGETATDSIGAVLHKDLDLGLLPPQTPARVRAVLDRCLVRDKSKRFRDIGDIRLELLREEPLADRIPDVVDRAPRRGRLGAIAGALTLVLVAASATWFVVGWATPEPSLDVRKFDVVAVPTSARIDISGPRISPDGRRVAFIQEGEIHVRDLSTFDAPRLTGAEGVNTLFWSPDGQWIGFATDEGIFRMLASGGGITRVSDAAVSYQPTWTEDDRIVFAEPVRTAEQTRGIIAVPARGGEHQTLVPHDTETSVDFHNVEVIPGSDVILYVNHLNDGRTPIMATDGERTVPIVDENNLYFTTMVWSPTGHVLYTKGFGKMDLWAVPFSPERLEVTGDPFLVMPEAGAPSVSDDGTLAVLRGVFQGGGELVWVSASGEVESIGSGAGFVQGPGVAPDGSRLAFATGSSPAKMDVWIRDIERGVNTRLTYFESFVAPTGWSPDGREIAVVTFDPSRDPPIKTHFFAVDGSGQTREPYAGLLSSFNREWTYAVHGTDPRLPEKTLSAFRLDDRTITNETITGTRVEAFGMLNPRGDLLLYRSRESQQGEFYCTRFPEGGGRWQITVDGGLQANWSLDGSAIYYTTSDGYFRVDVTREPQLRFSAPTPVFPEGTFRIGDYAEIHPAGDEGRHLAVRTARDEGGGSSRSISIIQNWYEEFREVGRR